MSASKRRLRYSVACASRQVIESDPERRRLVLTHNARLVNTSLSLAADSGQLKRGNTHHWIVTKVTEKLEFNVIVSCLDGDDRLL